MTDATDFPCCDTPRPGLMTTLRDELVTFARFLGSAAPERLTDDYLAGRDPARPVLPVHAGDGLNGLPDDAAAVALRSRGWDVYLPAQGVEAAKVEARLLAHAAAFMPADELDPVVDEDDLSWARDDLGLDASEDDVRSLAERRAREREDEPDGPCCRAQVTAPGGECEPDCPSELYRQRQATALSDPRVPCCDRDAADCDCPPQLYITFGLMYRREPHPSGHQWVHPDGYLEVVHATGHQDARGAVVRLLGRAWAFDYTDEPRASYHPLGALATLDASTGAVTVHQVAP